MDTTTFIQNAKEVHGDKYNYSSVIYKNCDTKVIILCNTCNNIFEQIPYNHINKKAGCRKCYCNKKNKDTLDNRSNDFIEKAKKVHGDKYDYSNVIYINSKTPIIIRCTICDIKFEQIKNTHLLGDGGCKQCQKIKFKKENTFTKEQFIERAIKVHGDKYDYSKVIYNNSQTKIIIKCNVCVIDFEQLANGHLSGRGCRKCGYKLIAESQKKLSEEFISKSKEVHGNKYDYSLVEYKKGHDKVTIICKTHGPFEQNGQCHLSGRGCNECGKINRALKQTFTQEEFIERAIKVHGDKYNYSEVIYINSQTKIILNCNICGYKFTQAPNSHLQGCGCDKCAHKINHENQRLNEKELIERAVKVHGDKFDYTNMNYINSLLPINIKCNKCNNIFQQLYPNHIKQNKGCPICDSRITEKILFDVLTSQYPTLIKEYKEEWCKNKKYLPFDFCIPELKIIIELDGNQHFKQIMNWKSSKKTQETDIYKMKCANENGFSVIRIIQTDVLYDVYDWKQELYNNIEQIKNDKFIQIIYMCKNNEYDIYYNS